MIGNSVVIMGASEQAKVAIDILEQRSAYNLRGLIDSYKAAGGGLYDHLILGAEDVLEQLWRAGEIHGGIIAVGDNSSRRKFAERVKARLPDFRFITLVHPSAVLGRGVSIGAGSIVMAGVVVNSDSTIGEHCIVNTKSSMDHDGVMGDFSSLGPGATAGGKVKIGEGSAIGLGANVIHGVSIGRDTVLGAGALAVADVPSDCVAYGVPARVVRRREPTDRYL